MGARLATTTAAEYLPSGIRGFAPLSMMEIATAPEATPFDFGSTLTCGTAATVNYELARPHRFGLRLVSLGSVSNEAQGHLEDFLGKATKLLQANADWDSYGARPVRPLALQSALYLVGPLLLSGKAPPQLIATSKGGVQVEWHRRGYDLELSFSPEGELHALFEAGATGEEYEGPLTVGSPQLTRYISLVAQ